MKNTQKKLSCKKYYFLIQTSTQFTRISTLKKLESNHHSSPNRLHPDYLLWSSNLYESKNFTPTNL